MTPLSVSIARRASAWERNARPELARLPSISYREPYSVVETGATLAADQLHLAEHQNVPLPDREELDIGLDELGRHGLHVGDPLLEAGPSGVDLIAELG